MIKVNNYDFCSDSFYSSQAGFLNDVGDNGEYASEAAEILGLEYDESEPEAWADIMFSRSTGNWNTDFAKKENISFSEMVKRCYKSRPWHENANIIYLHKDNLRTTIVPHACYYLDEAEENKMFDLLKKQLSKDDKEEK